MGKNEIAIQANEKSYNVAETSEVIDEQLCSNVVISIKNMLELLPPNVECSIYRVPKLLRDMNDKAYTPQVISIGPFHHCTRDDLKATERYKRKGFVNFLRRIYKMESLEDLVKAGSLEDLVKTTQSWVKEARNCYAEPINMNDEEFVEMMLVDGCFIVEFMILDYDGGNPHAFTKFQNNVDMSFFYTRFPDIEIDLIKLENQVPFFLLQRLFDLIPKHEAPISFINLAYDFFRPQSFVYYEPSDVIFTTKSKHLIDHFSYHFVSMMPSDMQKKKHEDENSEKMIFKNKFLSLFSRVPLHCLQKKHDQNQESNDQEKRITPPSITELCEAGVIIKKAKNPKCMTDISFKNGVFEIPFLHIDDFFEPMMRNLIAFEHFPATNEDKYIITYVLFMDDLINTEKDVSLLVQAEVIINGIGGSDKEVSDLFNNLSRFIKTIYNPYHFNDISKALRQHCNGWWNKAKASLKHNYFNTPWAVISFFAATFLILLTILQTIFSAISAFPN